MFWLLESIPIRLTINSNRLFIKEKTIRFSEVILYEQWVELRRLQTPITWKIYVWGTRVSIGGHEVCKQQQRTKKHEF